MTTEAEMVSVNFGRHTVEVFPPFTWERVTEEMGYLREMFASGDEVVEGAFESTLQGVVAWAVAYGSHTPPK